MGDLPHSDVTLQAFIFMTLTVVYLDMAHQEHH
jgi:F-type H+-transporting ATPase subunit a